MILDLNIIEHLPPCVFRRLTRLRRLSLRFNFIADLNLTLDTLRLLPELQVSLFSFVLCSFLSR